MARFFGLISILAIVSVTFVTATDYPERAIRAYKNRMRFESYKPALGETKQRAG